MPFRRFSRRMGRKSSLGTVIQSFKKVIQEAPASVGAGTNNLVNISNGVDSIAAGQTTAVDVQVPTGSVIKYIEIQWGVQNLVNVAAFVHTAIQYVNSGQTGIAADAVGGDPQRNQVLHQDFFCAGMNQNVNRTYKFKVPKKFQRVKEGTKWQFSCVCNNVSTQAGQIIYKFYR